MTKREICERLAKIRDNAVFEHGFIVGIREKEEKRAYLEMVSALRSAYNQISDLILDLAAPEEVAPPEKPKKEPPVLLYEENGEKTPCPVCGAPAAPIKNKPGVFLCKRCEGLVCAEEGKSPSRGIKEQFLALGEKAIKKIDFDKVADAEWEICSGSYERMLSWARGAIEGAVSKAIAGCGEAEFDCGCLDAKASRKNGRLRIELNHRRTKQYVEVEEEEGEKWNL